jgi:hypothetical protein
MIFPRPPRVPERHPPPQRVLSLRYSLSLCGSPLSSGARSSTAMYFLAPLSLVSSSPAAASLLVPLLPGGGGILGIFHRVPSEILHRSGFSRSFTPCLPLPPSGVGGGIVGTVPWLPSEILHCRGFSRSFTRLSIPSQRRRHLAWASTQRHHHPGHSSCISFLMYYCCLQRPFSHLSDRVIHGAPTALRRRYL